MKHKIHLKENEGLQDGISTAVVIILMLISLHLWSRLELSGYFTNKPGAAILIVYGVTFVSMGIGYGIPILFIKLRKKFKRRIK